MPSMEVTHFRNTLFFPLLLHTSRPFEEMASAWGFLDTNVTSCCPLNFSPMALPIAPAPYTNMFM